MVHRIRNWGESLLEPVVYADRGTIGDIDLMTDRLTVTVKLSRNVSVVREVINESLVEHGLSACATITEETLSTTD